MKALALAAALSVILSLAANAQDSQPSLKSNGIKKMPAEASATIDVDAIQKKIDEYTEAIKNDPKNDKYYGARGQNYWRVGRYELALKDLNQAISLNPKRQAYFEVRGDVYGKMKSYQAAYEDYGRAISSGSPSHYLYLQRGIAAFLMHNPRDAAESAKLALTMKPEDVQTLALAGAAERESGELNNSLLHLNKALILDPNNTYLLNLRADTYVALGRKDLARQDMDLAKKVDSSDHN